MAFWAVSALMGNMSPSLQFLDILTWLFFRPSLTKVLNKAVKSSKKNTVKKSKFAYIIRLNDQFDCAFQIIIGKISLKSTPFSSLIWKIP